MARHGPCVVLCAGVVLGALCPATAAPGEDVKARIVTQLAVQKALEEGQAQLKAGNYRAAIHALESQLHLIAGNAEYLNALRQAYHGYLNQSHTSNAPGDAKDYRARLAILDRPAARDRAPSAVTPAAATPGPAPAPTPSPGLVGRGKVEETDPFAEANSVAAHQARDLVARADREFVAKQYDRANALYASAHAASAKATAPCRERWAYCKLNAVVATLNAPPGEQRPAAELESEVRRAMELAPKLGGLGNDLLKKVRERSGGLKVEVKHTPRKGGGWALAETANFRVFHTQSPEQAERVARAAESARLALAGKWLGEAPPAWSPRCDIYLHPNRTDYARATAAPESNPGHSTIKLEEGRVVGRRIDLRCDDAHLLRATLPHETTHVVLAGHFGRHHVPRWADEGMAVLSEPRERIDLHLRNLPRHDRDGQLFGVGQLLRMEEYPAARSIGPFYAQSVSLVELLAQRKGPRAFTQFLRDGLDSGYEGALKKHYGIAGFAELERLWREHAFGARVAARDGR
jgi:hypothetical protein